MLRFPRPRVAYATILLVAVAPGTIAAQAIPSPYRYLEKGQEAGVFSGHLDADPGRFGIGPKGGTVFGARYGVEVSGPFGFESAVALFPTTRDVVNPRRAEGDQIVDEAEMTLFLLDANIRFSLTGRRTWHGLNPFVVIGGGLAFDLQGDQDEDQKLEELDRFDFGTGFTAILGPGLRWTLGERLTARSDLHLTLWKLDTPTGFQDEELGLEGVPESEWLNNPTVTFSLSYRF